MIHSIANEFIVMSPDKRATIETADQDLYQRLDERYNNFSGHELISHYEFSADWDASEMHPHGDEVVMLLSGEASLILQFDTGDEAFFLKNVGDYVIVPKGVWHTARTSVPTKLLFITPGEATEGKPV